jgi:gliding motility-associated-like protein
VLNSRYYIAYISLILFTLFSYGQDQAELDPACAESVEKYGVTGFEDSEFFWYLDQSQGTIIDGAGTDTVTIRWGYNTGIVEMEVHEVTASGCTNIPSRASLEIIAPYVDLGYDFPEICKEDTLILDVGTGFDSPYEILWFDGSSGSQYAAYESDTIWVRIIDGNGCIRYDTVSLLVNPLPELDLREDTILCNPWEIIPGPGEYSMYSWQRSTDNSFSSNEPYLIVESQELVDTITLTVTDNNGCSTTASTVILPCDLEEYFNDMPNAFTPNDDGENDKWVIPYMNLFEDAVLEIFDRWGRLVYRTTNVAEEPWDGTSKGRPMPMDAYYYVLNLNYLNTPPLVGTVNLIR